MVDDPRPVRYVADVRPRPRGLAPGTVDLDFWTDRLRPEELIPAPGREGGAQVLIIAAAMRAGSLGIRVAEVSVSVIVHPPAGGPSRQAAFLVGGPSARAGSSPFRERALFGTPYSAARCRVEGSPPALEVVASGAILRAAMGSGPTTAPRADSDWEGMVFLPSRRRGRRLFFAALRGPAAIEPFVAARDTVSIRPSPDVPALEALIDSGFAPLEWIVRPEARHARSRTFRRPAVPGTA